MKVYVILWISFIASGVQYARLTDEHWAVHFPEVSNTNQIIIPGVDGRFYEITAGPDYTMMSWV